MPNERPWWERLLSFGEKRQLKRITNRANAIADLEPRFEAMSDGELQGVTASYRQRHAAGETLDELLPEAFAAVREAGKRTMQMRHFDVQMIGGIALHEGNIAEMLTGEGKTLVATLPLYLNAIPGTNVHLITTNDYLAKRDAEWMGPIYRALGMSVGYLQNMQPRSEKKAAYACDITYGTNSEFGFDYLRDNMAFSLSDLVQRGHSFGIVDEVDSILIDEARTPLIISGQPEESSATYYKFAAIASKMEEGVHYELDEKAHTAWPTEEGVALAERELRIENLYLAEHNQLINHLIQAIKARALYHRDKEYVLLDGEVMIVDEHTGRVMEGRRWSEGLHQAVEAKENVAIREENVTVASITIQNYFRLYDKLAGMTGTAYTEAAEFSEIYDLSVVQIPPNRPVVRHDKQDQLFLSEQAKFNAVVNDIKERNGRGQPVLVGTIAVEKSEALANALAKAGIEYEVLNAKQHEREALIIKDAGQKGAVTIATNMAGRGVDIKIDDEVRELGGLYVLGTERHESRRIDNQLRGRSGRQGDPGESRFYISVDDDLARVFGGDRMKRILTSRLAEWPEDEPLEMGMLTRAIEKAQKRVEEINFLRRKNVLKYDDVLNTQRNVIYRERRRVLEGSDLRDSFLGPADAADDDSPMPASGWLADEIRSIVMSHAADPYPEQWDLDGMFNAFAQLVPGGVSRDGLDLSEAEHEDVVRHVLRQAIASYEQREQRFGAKAMRQVERVLFLQVLDHRWREHLDNMDYLRDGIGLRGYAQKQPLAEYQNEGYQMFNEMQAAIQGELVNILMHVELQPEDVARLSADADAVHDMTADGDGAGSAGSSELAGTSTQPGDATVVGWGIASDRNEQLTYASGSASGHDAMREVMAAEGDAVEDGPVITQRVVADKVGRNEPCPCGSGKKYKNCHGA